MPPSLTEFRNTLDIKVFDSVIASNLTASSVSGSTDKWGDITSSVTSLGSLKCVPYNVFSNRYNYQPFGELLEGEMDIVFKYDSGVTTGTLVTYLDGVVYAVKGVEDYPYGDGVLVKIVRLTKNH